MNIPHQIIIGASCWSENSKFLIMTMLVPLVIKIEIISSFYKYKYMGKLNLKKKEQEGQRKIAKGRILPQYTDQSFLLTLKFYNSVGDKIRSAFLQIYSLLFYPRLPSGMLFWNNSDQLLFLSFCFCCCFP